MTRLTEGRQQLALAHVERARRIAARWRKRWPWLRDEIESVTLYALCLAAAGYDPDRGAEFPTYLTRCVYTQVWRLVAGMTFARGCRSASAPVRVRVEPTAFDEYEPGDGCGPVGWELEYHDWLTGLFADLPDKGRTVLTARYGRAGCDAARVAAELGVSESRVKGLAVNGLRAIRERLRTTA